MARALREIKEYHEQELVIERPNGSRRTALVYASPFFDEFGQLAGAVNILVDVTERWQGGQAGALLAAIVHSSDDAIISKDLNGIITSWNEGAERLFGYTAGEAIGRSVTMLMPPDRVHEELAILEQLRRGERIKHFETVRMRKDGTLLDISLTISPVRDAAGRIVGASKVARDIRERKRAEEALQEADRKKDEFLATLAHELRNPLAPIRNGLQLMKLARNDSAAIEQSRIMMERQLGQMVRLIDDLLDVSRISQGKIELRKERIELATVVRMALESCEPLINQYGHELILMLPDEPVHVDADKTRLAQALCNLLNNAAKYSERNGRIRLTAQRQGNEAVLSVKDNGIGIPAAMLPKIYDLFMQVDQSLEKTHGGLGIGLTLVKRLIEMHGGRIEAKSEGPGRGSEFIVRLPMVLSLDGEPRDERDGEAAAATARRRILVVDDNVDAAGSLGMLLQMMGNEVRTAHDGLEGLKAAAEFRPNVILLDIGMPKLNGYDTCRRIRQEAWGGEIVLAAMTGWGQEEDKRRAREAGFNAHLVKPVSPKALASLLSQTQRTPA